VTARGGRAESALLTALLFLGGLDFFELVDFRFGVCLSIFAVGKDELVLIFAFFGTIKFPFRA
jgi:hypothetical protein